MSDVDTSREAVERLRRFVASNGDVHDIEAMRIVLAERDAERESHAETAEIMRRMRERLEAERDAERKLRRAAQDLGQQHADERDRLAAEAAKMREALEKIVEHCNNTGYGNPIVDNRTVDRCEETAMAALGTGGTP